MFQIERQAQILAAARTRGRVNVTDLAAEFSVTQETIRRDLDELETQGHVRRVHGGAIPVEGSLFELPLQTRSTNFLAEKQAIATRVIEALDDIQTVYLDEGSTAQVVAEMWNPRQPVTVVTSALATAVALAPRPNVSLFFLGGRVRSSALAVADSVSRAQLSGLVVDVAVLGANGVSLSHGCTCPDAGVAAMKSAAIQTARESWLAVDSSKFDTSAFMRFAEITEFTRLYTDDGADPEFLTKIKALGVDVVI